MDSVKNPAHYHLEGLEGIESIDILRAVAGQEMFGQFKTRRLIKAENEQEAKEEVMDKLYEETNHIIDIEIIDTEVY